MQKCQKIDEVSFIEGINFNGEMRVYDTSLKMDLTYFKKGELYTAQISDADVKRSYDRYLIFKNIHMLSDQITTNKNMEISDNLLCVPVEVTYRDKFYDLILRIPLNIKTYDNQQTKIQSLFQQIERLNNQKLKIQKYLPEPIYFQGDQTNKNFKYFKLSDNGKRIKRCGPPKAMIFNHSSFLPMKGTFYFTLRIIKGDKITLGVCSEHINQLVGNDITESKFFLALDLSNGQLFCNGESSYAVKSLKIKEGQSIFRVQINMSDMEISWYQDGNSICHSEIPKQLQETDICPMFTLKQSNDTVEIVIK